MMDSAVERSKTTTDLSIVIVTWNVRSLVTACLTSIRRYSRSLNVEVIVVDNASADNTVSAVRDEFPEALIVDNNRNLGFAKASNQGIAAAHGRNIMLLNPDTLVQEGTLMRLVAFADVCTDVGVVGPRLVSPDGTIQLACARSAPKLHHWFAYRILLDRIVPTSRLLGGLLMTWWDHTGTRPVDCLCGACMLIPRRVTQVLGGLDEEHPMYLEDIEYCDRSVKAGFRNYYLGDAVVVHYGGQSSEQIGAEAAIIGLEAFRLYFTHRGGRHEGDVFIALVLLGQVIRLPLVAVGWVGSKWLKSGRVTRGMVVREWTVLCWVLAGAPSVSSERFASS
jgi:O-antigen biosynthesis protein